MIVETRAAQRLRLLRGLMWWDVEDPLSDSETIEWLRLYPSSEQERLKKLVDWLEDYEG